MRSVVLGLGVVAGCVLASPHRAAATTRRCLPGPAIDVPLNPRFVVRDEDHRNRPPTAHTGSLRFKRVTIDAFSSRIEITARHGTELHVPGWTGRCGIIRGRVSRDWRRVDVAPTPSLDRVDAGMVVLQVDRHVEDARGLRVEWAIAAAELSTTAAGRFTSPYAKIDPVVQVEVPVEEDFELVFVRVTPLLLDGTEGRGWTGWVHRDPTTGVARLGQGAAPPTTRKLSCAPSPVWVVPPSMDFVFQGAERTFAATTPGGVRLRTRSSHASQHDLTVVNVTAKAGTTFRMEVLPRGTRCPIDVHVVDRVDAPRVTLQPTPKVTSSTRLAIDAPWPLVAVRYDVRTVTTKVIGGAIALDLQPADWSHVDADHDRIHLELAPVWSGFEGMPCEVWVMRERSTNQLSFARTSPQEPTSFWSCLASAP